MILSADFVRNVQTHYLLGIDENHTGDIHYFNKAAAQQAISATNSVAQLRERHRFQQYSMCDQRRRTDDRLRQQRLDLLSADFDAVCSSAIPDAAASAITRALSRASIPTRRPCRSSRPIGRSVYNGFASETHTEMRRTHSAACAS